MDGGVRKTREKSRIVYSSDDHNDEEDEDIESGELPVVQPNVRAERSASPYRDAVPIDIKRSADSNETVRIVANRF